MEMTGPVAVAGVLFLMLVTLWLSVSFRRLRARLQQQETALAELRADLRAVCAGTAGVSDHLARLERRAWQLVQRQEQFEVQDPADFSYRRAIKLARNGASAEELIEACGLSRGEADLIVRAHRIDKAG